MSMRRSAAAVLAVVVALLGVAGCADDEPPGRTVPELATQLDRVDAAIEEGDLDRARKATRRIVARTAVALADGDLTDDQADRIIEAAEALLAELPEDEPPSD